MSPEGAWQWHSTMLPRNSHLPKLLREGCVSMPRHRTHHSTNTSFFPQEFPQHLVQFKEESGHSRAALTHRLGTHPRTVRRWRNAGVGPGTGHSMALLEGADKPGLSHPLALRTWLHQDPGPCTRSTG